ncbi:HAD family hydrolase [Paenibacillus gorillae]|uniref:HAD family hydrolase n=1 Tax=Paenibacillus gorillae TaxID=1243662 RepID=UPI0004AD6DAA|nr:HAD-IA family hydrolase [Paenibacillus gorillae]
MKVKAVFFDLFETLISEFENGSRKAARSTRLEEALGVDSKLFRKEWNARQLQRMDGAYSDFPSVIHEILEVLGHAADEEVVEALHQERIAEKAAAFDKLDQRILSMLEQVKELGIQICLISNCTHEEVTAWHSSGLAASFDAALFSYQVKAAKPNPDIYLLACEKMGVTPAEALFVGDGGSNELEGAAKVGMTAYQATWFVPPYISEKIAGYLKLAEPLELLEQIQLHNSR